MPLYDREREYKRLFPSAYRRFRILKILYWIYIYLTPFACFLIVALPFVISVETGWKFHAILFVASSLLLAFRYQTMHENWDGSYSEVYDSMVLDLKNSLLNSRYRAYDKQFLVTRNEIETTGNRWGDPNEWISYRLSTLDEDRRLDVARWIAPWDPEGAVASVPDYLSKVKREEEARLKLQQEEERRQQEERKKHEAEAGRNRKRLQIAKSLVEANADADAVSTAADIHGYEVFDLVERFRRENEILAHKRSPDVVREALHREFLDELFTRPEEYGDNETSGWDTDEEDWRSKWFLDEDPNELERWEQKSYWEQYLSRVYDMELDFDQLAIEYVDFNEWSVKEEFLDWQHSEECRAKRALKEIRAQEDAEEEVEWDRQRAEAIEGDDAVDEWQSGSFGTNNSSGEFRVPIPIEPRTHPESPGGP